MKMLNLFKKVNQLNGCSNENWTIRATFWDNKGHNWIYILWGNVS